MSAAANSDPMGAITAQRLALHRNGYVPVPVSDPNPMLSSGGKAPLFKDWRNVALAADETKIATWPDTVRRHRNTGLLTGDLVGLDLDTPDPETAARIGALADALLPATPLHRVGRSPKSLRCYRAAAPLPKLETAELHFPDGGKAQVEALGAGQQFVAFGTHPDTGQPYTWTKGTPEATPFASLPEVTEAALRGFLAAAEAVLRAAGGRTEAEIKKDAAPNPIPLPAAARPDAMPAKPRKGAGGGEFFQAVNRAALGNIGRWLPSIFPTAAEEAGTGAWRVSSADMGRGLEEDLSVHPEHGGQDFGTRESCSPIDVAIRHGGAPTAQDAAFWLCERLGRQATDFGWKEPRAKKDRPKREDRPVTGLPMIRIQAGELHLNTTAAEDAMIAARVAVYQRGRSLVRPVSVVVPASDDRTTMAAALADMTPASVVDTLSAVAEWEKYDGRSEAWVRANPPKLVAEILLGRFGDWRVPVLAGVITTPTMRPDGSILVAPGYDPATRLYHVADHSLRLHPAVQNPTRADAERALVLLRELIAEFPFVNEVSRAVALSALVTPVVRGAIPVAPMHLFRAPAPGTGKSYLADVSSAISTGRICPAVAAGTEEETEKRLVGLLLSGVSLISLDNVNGELGGDLLCQAVERPLLAVRQLGGSSITEIENRATVLGNGNNMRLRGDMVRRGLVADLDAGIERPETRVFKADPVATVLNDRSRYVSACLIVVRAYIVAGAPGRLNRLASFGGWSDLVRSALVWLGAADPAKSIETARDDDSELGELRAVMDGWKAALGLGQTTVRELVDSANSPVAAVDEHGNHSIYAVHAAFRQPELRDALMQVAGNRGVIDPARVGRWLLRHQGRIVSGLKFRRAEKSHNNVAAWCLDSTNSSEVA